MRRPNPATGLEGAPDIMLLTMAALMVAIVWLVSQAHETTLPPIELPSSDVSRLGCRAAAAETGTQRPETALRDSGASAVTLRADSRTSWQAGLEAMSAAARQGMAVSVAAER